MPESGRQRSADPKFSFVARLDERSPEVMGLLHLQRDDRIRIQAGAYDPVHRRRHGTNDRVANTLRHKQLSDVQHQQRRLARRASPHCVARDSSGAGGLSGRPDGAQPCTGNGRRKQPAAAPLSCAAGLHSGRDERYPSTVISCSDGKPNVRAVSSSGNVGRGAQPGPEQQNGPRGAVRFDSIGSGGAPLRLETNWIEVELRQVARPRLPGQPTQAHLVAHRRDVDIHAPACRALWRPSLRTCGRNAQTKPRRGAGPGALFHYACWAP